MEELDVAYSVTARLKHFISTQNNPILIVRMPFLIGIAVDVLVGFFFIFLAFDAYLWLQSKFPTELRLPPKNI